MEYGVLRSWIFHHILVSKPKVALNLDDAAYYEMSKGAAEKQFMRSFDLAKAEDRNVIDRRLTWVENAMELTKDTIGQLKEKHKGLLDSLSIADKSKWQDWIDKANANETKLQQFEKDYTELFLKQDSLSIARREYPNLNTYAKVKALETQNTITDSLLLAFPLAKHAFAWISFSGGGKQNYATYDATASFDNQIQKADYNTYYFGVSLNCFSKNMVNNRLRYFNFGLSRQRTNNLDLLGTKLITDTKKIVNTAGEVTRTVEKKYNAYTDPIIDDEGWKFFLNSYFLRNKAALLQDVELDRFANSLAEVLRLANELNDNAPKLGMTYREMISVATGIDIGDTQPWHRSPVVQKILDDPQGMVKANKKEAYIKTEKGLKFDLMAFAGGEEALNYQNEGIPKAKRPFVKVLRRATSPKSSISAGFALSGVPELDALLTLVGLDDEKPGHASFQVLVNGESVFDGENTFGEDDWSQMKIQIPAKVLKKGANTLEIKNTTLEKISAVADIYGAKDYFWGWFMIADAEMTFAPGNNPVVEKAPLILDDWKRARIGIRGVGEKKITASGGWVTGSSPLYAWGESKTLSDKWEDMTVSVVPEDDCNLRIDICGPWRPKEKGSKELLPIWADYDDLKIEGTTLKNTSFETLNAQMLPEGWECASANVVTDETAADGKTYIRACFDQPVLQTVAAKAGQAVTITVKVRRSK